MCACACVCVCVCVYVCLCVRVGYSRQPITTDHIVQLPLSQAQERRKSPFRVPSSMFSSQFSPHAGGEKMRSKKLREKKDYEVTK